MKSSTSFHNSPQPVAFCPGRTCKLRPKNSPKSRFPYACLALAISVGTLMPRLVQADQLDPTKFQSLGASPFVSGDYSVDTTFNNPRPVILQGQNRIEGVFYDPTPEDTGNRDEIAVFTFDSINVPAGVTLSGVQNANSRPFALLSQADAIIVGVIDLSGANGNNRNDSNQAGAGGAAGPAAAEAAVVALAADFRTFHWGRPALEETALSVAQPDQRNRMVQVETAAASAQTAVAQAVIGPEVGRSGATAATQSLRQEARATVISRSDCRGVAVEEEAVVLISAEQEEAEAAVLLSLGLWGLSKSKEAFWPMEGQVAATGSQGAVVLAAVCLSTALLSRFSRRAYWKRPLARGAVLFWEALLVAEAAAGESTSSPLPSGLTSRRGSTCQEGRAAKVTMAETVS